MSWISIPHAHEYWRLNRRRATPPSDLDDVEAFILTAPPQTIQDAACILDVILANEGDMRTDGLDRSALKRVRGLLAAVA
jgi:hypothetical protein